MSEDKKEKKEEKDIKTEDKSSDIKVADDKSADIKIEKTPKESKLPAGQAEEKKVVSVKDEVIVEEQKIDGLEELPEEIKKKLEKKKNENKAGKGKLRKKKKKVEKMVSVGRAFIQATYNNTIVSLTDLNGNVLAWASAGIAGFKGPKKSTPYAASIITRIAVEKARECGLKEVNVYVKGVGTGRESAVRALNANGLEITYIKDVTPMPHNGCRKRRPRRV